jgi:hypothetical protein
VLPTLLLAAITASGAGASGSSGVSGPGEANGPPTRAEIRAATAEFERRYGNERGSAKREAVAPKAPQSVLPQNRFVTFYGAPQLGATIIGRKSPNGAARKLRKQAKPYMKRSEKPIIRGFDIIATIATPCSGRRDKCRTHQKGSVLKRYLKEARQLNGRLILDIQPGRASVKSEVGHFRKFLKKPDVDIAIDPEWNVGRREEPGRDQGSIGAGELNKVSAKMQRLIDEENLPDKMMIVHQFRAGSIRNGDNTKQRDGVDVVFNFDGIGSPSAKRAGYRNLHEPGIFDGFSLFYRLDSNMMSAGKVMDLNPRPDYVMYQ